MQDHGCGLPRTYLLGTSVNKGKKKRKEIRSASQWSRVSALEETFGEATWNRITRGMVEVLIGSH
jgi:hypothetical protein